jgi:parvulin-like peptidyl-prolyl isomerase
MRWYVALSLCALGLVACVKPSKVSVEEHVRSSQVAVTSVAKPTPDKGPRPDQGHDKIVATWDSGTVSLADMGRWGRALSEFDRMRYQSDDRKKELLTEIISLELLAGEAISAGYDERPDVRLLMKLEVARRFLEDKVKDQVSLKDITEEAVWAYFDTHRAEFLLPETRRAWHVLVSGEAVARRVRSELLQAAAQAPDSLEASFIRAVKQYSEDQATRIADGELGYIDARGEVHGIVRRQTVCPELARAVFSLPELPAATGFVTCDDGLHMAFVSESRPAVQQRLEEVSPRIKNRLLQDQREEARRALIDELVAKAGVSVNEEHLSTFARPPKRSKLPKLKRIRHPVSPRTPVHPFVGKRKAPKLDDEKKREMLEEQRGKALK